MTKVLFLIIIFIANTTMYGQLRSIPIPRKPPTEQKALKDILNQSCVHVDKISIENRSKIFPFSKAIKIQLVSFQIPDSILTTYYLPRTKNSIDYSRLSEVITIDTLEINSLTDILYNYGFKGVFHSFIENRCLYSPKNAVLFLDKQNRVFANIEICFKCGDYRISDKRINMGEICEGKFDLLKSLFRKNGIRIGTSDQ